MHKQKTESHRPFGLKGRMPLTVGCPLSAISGRAAQPANLLKADTDSIFNESVPQLGLLATVIGLSFREQVVLNISARNACTTR